jgi:hypothetical protein
MTLILARPDIISDSGSFKKSCFVLYTLALAHVSFDLLVVRKSAKFWIAIVFLGLLAAQSWLSIFAPSVFPGVPIVDYRLSKDTSAYFQWDFAREVIGNLYLFFIVAIGGGVYFSRGVDIRSIPVRVFFIAVILNVFSALIQGMYNINFLAAGSGSAVSVGRAAALFEDSGASTVLFSAGLSFAAARLLIEPNLVTALCVTVIAIAGYQTGGRTFFVSSFAGLVVTILLYLVTKMASRKTKWGFRDMLVLSGTGFLMAVIFLRIPESIRKVIYRFFGNLSTEPNVFENLASCLWDADVVRATSLRVMVLAARSHFWDGAGFATYQTYYREFFPQVLATWRQGYDWTDLPSTLYAALPAELGWFTALSIFGFVTLWLLSRADTILSKERLPHAAALAAILCSFWFGIHIIFKSFVVALGLIIASFETLDVPKFNIKVGKILIISMFFGLVISIVIKVKTAPPMVEYRSAVLGQPQMPVPINAPISSRGRQGQWLASGAEIFYPGGPLKIFIEHPSEKYPVTVLWEIRDRHAILLDQGRETISSLDTEAGGIELSVPGTAPVRCAVEYNRDSYCSLKVTTKPSWKWGRDRLGWFYINT